MGLSRNPTEFLRRYGLSSEPTGPKPRLSPFDLLVHTTPLAPPNPTQEVQSALGMSSDRGLTRGRPGTETAE